MMIETAEGVAVEVATVMAETEPAPLDPKLPQGPNPVERAQMILMKRVLDVIETHIQQEQEHLVDVNELRSRTPYTQSVGALAALHDLQDELEAMDL